MCSNGFQEHRLINTICQVLENGPFPAARVKIEQIIHALYMDTNNAVFMKTAQGL